MRYQGSLSCNLVSSPCGGEVMQKQLCYHQSSSGNMWALTQIRMHTGSGLDTGQTKDGQSTYVAHPQCQCQRNEQDTEIDLQYKVTGACRSVPFMDFLNGIQVNVFYSSNNLQFISQHKTIIMYPQYKMVRFNFCKISLIYCRDLG